MDASELYSDLSEESKQVLYELANEIKEERNGEPRGRVILFLGAAANYHAPEGFEEAYSKTDRPPIGSELNNLLIDEIFSPKISESRNRAMKEERLSLSYTAQYLQETKDRKRLIEKLAEVIDNKKPSPILRALAEMNFKYIVTTNYDNLFEEALFEVGKKEYHKGVYQANITGTPKPTFSPGEEASVKKPFIYKFHGDIKNAVDEQGNYVKDGDSIVLTDEDYLHFILRMSQVSDNKEKTSNKENLDFYPVPQPINEAFIGKNQNTFLFIGYGLQDYNLRLIFKTSLWKKDQNIFKELQKWSIAIGQHKPIMGFYTKNYNFTFIEHNIWCAVSYLYKAMFDKEMPLK
ncbi:MAG: hypothetical protein JWR09_1296 [Mucilaginibacter sp.]|nr:hypothetical protein [Mucilaginibacter sp.]